MRRPVRLACVVTGLAALVYGVLGVVHGLQGTAVDPPIVTLVTNEESIHPRLEQRLVREGSIAWFTMGAVVVGLGLVAFGAWPPRGRAHLPQRRLATMETGQVRAKAICVFRRADRILVAYATDRVKSQRYARPLGGTMEFGERAIDTLRREIREELGLELCEPVLLGVLENLFVLEGRPGHEVIFVFDATFVDARAYDVATLPLMEVGWDGPAEWATIETFRTGTMPLYPDGLLGLLDGRPPAPPQASKARS